MPIIILIVGVVILLLVIGLYNNLVRKRNEVDFAFAAIDTQLKKRYDLIPNLVATVQEYARHEKELLTKVVELRAKAVSGNLSQNEQVDLNNQLSAGIRNLMVAMEAYPELKANENFMNLQRNLTEIESQIAAARRTYNAAVTDFNNSIQVFPANIFAGMLGFTARQLFVIPEAERQNVNVKQLFS